MASGACRGGDRCWCSPRLTQPVPPKIALCFLQYEVFDIAGVVQLTARQGWPPP